MGYADGYYYGQGKIICDTAAFTAGDTIRVRSMTDANKIWNKTVVTAGTPLIFEVPGKDYYKICTVQTISDVETEIGGVYKTIDYGQTLFTNVLDKTTLQGIQAILNSHSENDVLNIGDEVNFKYDRNGTPTEFNALIGRIDGVNHVIDFVGKYLLPDDVLIGIVTKYSETGMKTALTNFYNSIEERAKQFIKIKSVKANCDSGGRNLDTSDNYVWLPTATEVFGSVANQTNLGPELNYNSQMPIFTTSANRIKTKGVGLSASNWGTASISNENSTANTWWIYSTTSGSIARTGNTTSSSAFPVLPCFRLTADS